jgi:hypothetical protein
VGQDSGYCGSLANQRSRGEAIATSWPVALRLRSAGAARNTAAALAAILFAGGVVLTALTHDPWPTNDGLLVLLLLVFAAVGFVVVRRQPRNAVGWLMLGVALVGLLQLNVTLYLVLDYRLHSGALPMGTAAARWSAGYALLPLLIGLPVIVLFPDGRLSPRWRRLLWGYLAIALVFSLAQFTKHLPVGRLVQVNLRGRPTNVNDSTIAGLVWVLAPLFLIAWGSFVAHQVRRWRRADGEQREQLKWLMAGGAICVVSAIAIVLGGDPTTTPARAVADVSTIGVGALPIGIGVGILRYRLYEIDRLLSRTLAYAILTGLLVGVYVGLVTLATRVLPFSSPVAVAGSTLAAAALFNPLRRRIQRSVDRRFNRARYDAAATLAVFVEQLRISVELDVVRTQLLDAVQQTLEPSQATVWLGPTG